MKTILIATDFSKASRNASVYGFRLGQAMNAKVILFTAYKVSHPIASMNVGVSHFGAMKEVESKLLDEAKAITDGDDFQMEVTCEEGSPHDAILTIVAEKGADLIIMGMQGNGRNLKQLFGSTTTSLLKETKVPILVVPEEASFTEIKEIAYASAVINDSTIEEINNISWLSSFFNSKLHIVHVVKDREEEVRERGNTPQILSKELQDVSTTFHFPINTNITDGLNAFVKEQSIDLLVMSPHKHEGFNHLFVKSETKDMIFHTHIPLLALPM